MLRVAKYGIRGIASSNMKIGPLASLRRNQILFRSLSEVSNDDTIKSSKKGPVVKFKAYCELVKHRLTATVALTTAAGFLLAGGPVDMATLGYACLGTALCSASAATLNEIFEKDADAVMNRTNARPIPAGLISVKQATTIAAMTGIGGTALLYTLTNPTVAMLGAGNILLYSGLYTYSKRVSEINTWIGAVVGAIPPVMGWVAATNQLVAMEPLLVGSLLYLWQMPHFFALAWMHRVDYERGGFQMVSVNDPTGERTAKLISNYSTSLLLIPMVASLTGEVGSMFIIESSLLTAPLLYLSSKFSKSRTNGNARKIFLYSVFYLVAVLTGMVYHSKNWDRKAIEAKQQQQLEHTNKERNGDEEPDLETDKITISVLKAKDTLKEYCVHEVIVHKEETSMPQLCPKVVADKTLDKLETPDSIKADNEAAINNTEEESNQKRE